jgi:hypothetical protein
MCCIVDNDAQECTLLTVSGFAAAIAGAWGADAAQLRPTCPATDDYQLMVSIKAFNVSYPSLLCIHGVSVLYWQ